MTYETHTPHTPNHTPSWLDEQMHHTWGRDVQVARRFNDLRHNPNLTIPEQQEFNGYLDEHDHHLQQTANQLDQRAGEAAGVTVQPFSTGESTAFTLKDDQLDSPLRLQDLGTDLPPIDEETEGTPLALVLHGAATGGTKQQTEAIELLLRGKDQRLTSLYLENARAAAGDATPGHNRWVPAGLSSFSGRRLKVWQETTERKKGDKHAITLMAGTERHDETVGEARVIRAVPNRIEAAAAGVEKPRRAKRFLKKLATTALAGIAFSLAPIHGDDPGKNQEITTAQEMVQPAGTNVHNGIKQAEGFFKEDTLDRSRKAFDAYFKGDKTALAEQAKAQGYEGQWMDPKAVEAMQQAQSPEELEQAFKLAFKDLPVSLKVCNDEAALRAIANSHYDYTPLTDLDTSKELALSVAETWNTIDKRYMKTMQPLEYLLTDDLDAKDDVPSAAGYYHQAWAGEKEDQIVLSHSLFADEDHLVRHETGHYLGQRARVQSADLNQRTNQLNPENFEHTGYNMLDALLSSTNVDGEHVNPSGYANSSDKEGLAEIAAPVLDKQPELAFEQSALNEKQQAIIYQMEELQPGYTASLLQRTTADRPSVLGKIVNAVGYYRERHALPLGMASGFLLMGALFAAWRGRRNTAALKQYGVVAGGRGFVYDAAAQDYRPLK